MRGVRVCMGGRVGDVCACVWVRVRVCIGGWVGDVCVCVGVVCVSIYTHRREVNKI
jgi:hypothetical protein